MKDWWVTEMKEVLQKILTDAIKRRYDEAYIIQAEKEARGDKFVEPLQIDQMLEGITYDYSPMKWFIVELLEEARKEEKERVVDKLKD